MACWHEIAAACGRRSARREQEQPELRGRAGGGLPFELRPHGAHEPLAVVAAAAQRVHPRLEVVDAVHEERQADARRPGQAREGARAGLRPGRGQHAVEALAREGRAAVHLDRAAPLARQDAEGDGLGRRVGLRGRALDGLGLDALRPARELGGEGDAAPLDVLGAQAVRTAEVLERGELGGPRRRRRAGGAAGRDREQRLRALALRRERLLQTEQHVERLAPPPRRQPRLPPQRGRGERDAGERVPQVVLAVAEGALAVLPRLAPGDRAQHDQERARRQLARDPLPQRRRQARAQLERVLPRAVVHEHRPPVEALERGQQRVALGRVQVAAGGVDAQRPARALVLLPGGQAERVLEARRHVRDAQRRRRLRRAAEHVVVARALLDRRVRQRDLRRALVPAERLGLVVPVEVAGPGRVALDVMAGRAVVGAQAGDALAALRALRTRVRRRSRHRRRRCTRRRPRR